MKKNFIIFLVIILSSCVDTPTFNIEKATNFDVIIFDSLKTDSGITLSNIICNKKKTLLYIANNECSECISNFIDFNNITKNNISQELNLIYVIYGYDKLSFDYYLDRFQIHINEKAFIVYDTLDVFHDKIRNYYSNNLFIINEKGTIYSVKSNIPEYEWNLNELFKINNSLKIK